jgi:hypothetical protein
MSGIALLPYLLAVHVAELAGIFDIFENNLVIVDLQTV